MTPEVLARHSYIASPLAVRRLVSFGTLHESHSAMPPPLDTIRTDPAQNALCALLSIVVMVALGRVTRHHTNEVSATWFPHPETVVMADSDQLATN
jgi:hypothetical protein